MNKEVFLRKLITDDFVELKSIRECKAQNLLPTNVDELFKDGRSCEMPSSITCHPEMAECFGKVLYVHQLNTDILLEEGVSDRICLMTPNNNNYWYWPLEMVKK